MNTRKFIVKSGEIYKIIQSNKKNTNFSLLSQAVEQKWFRLGREFIITAIP